MNLIAKFLTVAALGLSSLAMAAGGGESNSTATPQSADPTINTVRAAIAAENWTAARETLRPAVAASPNNADYHNLYAYVIRKGPSPDMDLVFHHYNEALRIDPKHRGAREYLGEAYLSVKNLAKAKEQLAALDRLCFLPCEEYTDLKKAVAKYESERKLSGASN